jgi:haloacetate dehalogenase
LASRQLRSLFPSARHGEVKTPYLDQSITIPFVIEGSGPPLLLLHGHPQTRVIWHKVWPELVRRFTVVASDIRGYGDAGKPQGGERQVAYSKREMARDQVNLMAQLGFERFRLVGHDRGARVAHRLALDHPQAVESLTVLDICPTLAMYEKTDMAFARAYWHWFFLIQNAPFPEDMINADPVYYLGRLMNIRSSGVNPFAPEAMAEYLRCAQNPECVRAMCEDYRAAADLDLEHDRLDRASGVKLTMPMQALWGAHGVVGNQFEPLVEWRKVALDVCGEALPCGHYVPEEAPEALLAALLRFYSSH